MVYFTDGKVTVILNLHSPGLDCNSGPAAYYPSVTVMYMYIGVSCFIWHVFLYNSYSKFLLNIRLVSYSTF